MVKIGKRLRDWLEVEVAHKWDLMRKNTSWNLKNNQNVNLISLPPTQSCRNLSIQAQTNLLCKNNNTRAHISWTKCTYLSYIVSNSQGRMRIWIFGMHWSIVSLFRKLFQINNNRPNLKIWQSKKMSRKKHDKNINDSNVFLQESSCELS